MPRHPASNRRPGRTRLDPNGPHVRTDFEFDHATALEVAKNIRRLGGRTRTVKGENPLGGSKGWLIYWTIQ